MLLKNLTILFVSLGTVFLMVSLWYSSKMKSIVPSSLLTRWHIISILIFFFVTGYTSFLFIQIKDIDFPLEFMTGCIFLGGALFVFLVVSLSKITIYKIFDKENALNTLNIKLKKAHDELELKVQDRTKKLSATNLLLEKEIEERKQTTREIKLAHAELDQIFQTAADGLRIIDKDFNMVRVNDRFLSLANAGKTGWEEKKCYEVFSGAFCHTPDCSLTRIVNGDDYLEIEVEKQRQDGTSVHCILAATPHLDHEGNLLGIIEDFKDITERKNAEEALKQSFEKSRQLAEELNTKNATLIKIHEELKASQSQILQQEKMASVGQLAAGVAHEINNPIGFIMSNMSTLNKYGTRLKEFMGLQTKISGPVLSPESLEELNSQRNKLKVDYILEDFPDLIKESLDGAERVKEIVQNLKSFSRVDQAENNLADINECLENTIKIIWNELKYKCEVVKEYDDLPLTVCLPQQLNQVFMNLLVNAAQAIEKQGVITIKTWAENNSIFVSISDTGCGIPEKNLAKLFEPFFTTKDIGKGTGLGLSIAYDIITKNHNGGLSVDSEAGKGTIFTVRIPVVEQTQNN